MAIRTDYGMGTYNPRVPTANIVTPSISGGVTTPLGFFPSTASGSIDEAIDTSLQDLIESNSNDTDIQQQSSDTATAPTKGLGLGKTAGTAAGFVTNVAGGMLQAPAAVTGITANLINKLVAEDEITAGDVAIALGKGTLTAINPVLGMVASATEYAADKFGLMDIGAVFGPSDERLGYTRDETETANGWTGRVTAAEEEERETTKTNTPDFDPNTYSGPKAAEDSSSESSDSKDSNDSSSDSGDKIVCTAMNRAYGFGLFRNAIWILYAAKHLHKYHEVGYHTIFMPLVHCAYYSKVPNKTLRKFLEHVARHRTADLRAVMYGRKRDNLGAVYRIILEPICYVVGYIKSKLTSLPQAVK